MNLHRGGCEDELARARRQLTARRPSSPFIARAVSDGQPRIRAKPLIGLRPRTKGEGAAFRRADHARVAAGMAETRRYRGTVVLRSVVVVASHVGLPVLRLRVGPTDPAVVADQVLDRSLQNRGPLLVMDCGCGWWCRRPVLSPELLYTGAPRERRAGASPLDQIPFSLAFASDLDCHGPPGGHVASRGASRRRSSRIGSRNDRSIGRMSSPGSDPSVNPARRANART